MDQERKERIIKTAGYIENGDPIKNWVDKCDIGDIIIGLAELLKKEKEKQNEQD